MASPSMLTSFGTTADNPAQPANVLLCGDSLDVMRRLRDDPQYADNVRLAYLDPPFNTGERSREYSDSFASSDWLSFMAARTSAAWSLLRPDGSLWLHCDDSEQAAAKMMMQEQFGRGCFVATIVWQRRYSRENRRAFSSSHDYLHVFSPAGAAWKFSRNRLPRQDRAGTWRNPDDDPRGPWSTVALVAQGGHGTPGQFYDIRLPSGRLVTPPKGSCWRVTHDRFHELVRSGEIWFGPNGNNVPRRKVFLRDAKGLVPSTWWPHTEVGHNAEANSELRRLLSHRAPFSTPKPERLLRRIIELATQPGEVVLDPFLGSATTVAVAHKLKRSWVGVEVDRSTLREIALPRLLQVVSGEDRGGISSAVGWQGGGGFFAHRSISVRSAAAPVRSEEAAAPAVGASP
jgi:adenine-specific DNA-methyltransferase